jgi:hypothetical protein
VAVYDGTTVRLVGPFSENASTDPGQCYATPDNIDPKFAPSCNAGNVSYIIEHNGGIEKGNGTVSGKPFSIGESKVTYFYTDITTHSWGPFLVTVKDITPPEVICKNISVKLDATGHINISVSQIENGSYDACGIKTLLLSKTSFDCSDTGENEIVLTATDNNNNTSSCTATVKIEDSITPIAKCRNTIVQLDSNGMAAVLPSDMDNGSTDVCPLTFSVSKGTFDCSNIGINDLTLSVADRDNIASCASKVTVEDKIVPYISNILTHPDILWPPNNKMVEVTISYTSMDNCPGTKCIIDSVRVFENGTEIANTASDWEITGTSQIRLKSKKSPGSTNRVYVLMVRCTDSSGNFTTAGTEVKVANTKNYPVPLMTLVNEFELIQVHPNPTHSYSNIVFNNTWATEKIRIQVFDQLGRSVEDNTILNGATFRLGDNYNPGTYFVKISQGKQFKVLKLIKLTK